MNGMHPRAAVAGLLAAAFVVRLASNWWLTSPQPALGADATWYHASATLLAEGRGYIHHFTGQPTAAWPPGYPVVLAVLYRLFGPDPAWAYLLNAVLGTATCWLAGRLALAVASPRAQVASVALLAFLPSHVLFASLLLSETLFAALLLALLVAAVRLADGLSPSAQPAGQRASSPAGAGWKAGGARAGRTAWIEWTEWTGWAGWAGWAAWGGAAGLAALVRAEAVLVFAVVAAAAWRSGAALRTTVARLVVAGLTAALVLTPWLVRNADVFGSFVPVSTSFGRTFLIGHNPEADGGMNLYSPDADADQRDLAGGGPAGEVAVDRRLRDAGLRFARENPGAELALVGRRFHHLYRGDRAWGEWYVRPPGVSAGAVSALGAISNLYYWLLLVAALPGLVFALRDRRAAAAVPLATVLVWTAFFVVVLYGSPRFHFPLMPVFCVLAAWSVTGASARPGEAGPVGEGAREASGARGARGARGTGGTARR